MNKFIFSLTLLIIFSLAFSAINPANADEEKPDLIVESVGLMQTMGMNNVLINKWTDFSIRCTNIGNIAVSEPYEISINFGTYNEKFEFENNGGPTDILKSGEPSESNQYYPLNPHGELHVDYAGKFLATGTITLTVTIDPTNQIAELNEDNNAFTKVITLYSEAEYPDFIIKDIVVTPAEPKIYEPAKIEVIHQNIGDDYWGTLGSDYITGINFGQRTDAFVFDKYFKASSTKTTAAPWKSNSTFIDTYMGYFKEYGSKELRTQVNPNQRIISEQNTTNNEFSKNITVKKENPQRLSLRLSGRIVLQVEKNGEAWYIYPKNTEKIYLGRPQEAFEIMRFYSTGITNSDLNKIPVAANNLAGPDTDNDGLSDIFEDAIGTNKNNPDSDNDGYDDRSEALNNYNPNGGGTINIDETFAKEHYGKIFLQTENNGEAWYINPADGKRYFLGRPTDAFNIMRNLGLGITEDDFKLLI